MPSIVRWQAAPKAAMARRLAGGSPAAPGEAGSPLLERAWFHHGRVLRQGGWYQLRQAGYVSGAGVVTNSWIVRRGLAAMRRPGGAARLCICWREMRQPGRDLQALR